MFVNQLCGQAPGVESLSSLPRLSIMFDMHFSLRSESLGVAQLNSIKTDTVWTRINGHAKNVGVCV